MLVDRYYTIISLSFDRRKGGIHLQRDEKLFFAVYRSPVIRQRRKFRLIIIITITIIIIIILFDAVCVCFGAS